jgi:hypothetical protein
MGLNRGIFDRQRGYGGRMATVGERIELTAAQARAFLGSPAGVLFRRYLAAGVIVTAPLLFRIPGLRRYPLIRVVELVGGAALLIKAAEAIRDWDASGGQQQHIVIDV